MDGIDAVADRDGSVRFRAILIGPKLDLLSCGTLTRHVKMNLLPSNPKQ